MKNGKAIFNQVQEKTKEDKNFILNLKATRLKKIINIGSTEKNKWIKRLVTIKIELNTLERQKLQYLYRDYKELRSKKILERNNAQKYIKEWTELVDKAIIEKTEMEINGEWK